MTRSSRGQVVAVQTLARGGASRPLAAPLGEQAVSVGVVAVVDLV